MKMAPFFFRFAFFLILIIPGVSFAVEKGQMKLGFIYSGPIGDTGWTYAHERCRLQLEKTHPYIKTFSVPNVSTGDAKKVMQGMIDQGVRVIVATSWDYYP